MIKREISDEEFMDVAANMAANDERLKPFIDDFKFFLYTAIYTSMLCSELFPSDEESAKYEELYHFNKGQYRYVVAKGGKDTPAGLVRVMIYRDGNFTTHHDYPNVIAALADIIRHI